jgi:hypothetical protein
MPQAFILDFEGATVEQYHAICDRLDKTHMFGGMAAGGMVHICTKTEHGLRIYDVWHSAHAMELFVHQALVPLLQELKIAPPKVTPAELVSVRK